MSFRVRMGKKGVELRLHDLEAAIMEVVWRRKLADFTVTDVLKVLQKDREIAYTTVMTTLSRLHEKGLLSRKRDGKRYLYGSTLSREQFLENTAQDVLDRAVGERQALAMLVNKVAEASADELDELEALIRRRRQGMRHD